MPHQIVAFEDISARQSGFHLVTEPLQQSKQHGVRCVAEDTNFADLHFSGLALCHLLRPSGTGA